MIRRFGEVPKLGISYIIRPGAYAILERDGRVLLTHQQSPVPEYQLPGGGIDKGESPIQALHREVMEETGWSIQAQVKLGVYRRFVFMPEYDMMAEKVCHVFLARPCMRVSAPTEPGHTPIWSDFENAMDVIASSGDRSFLSQRATSNRRR